MVDAQKKIVADPRLEAMIEACKKQGLSRDQAEAVIPAGVDLFNAARGNDFDAFLRCWVRSLPVMPGR